MPYGFQIKVSLQTDGECVRRYSPPIEPTNRNNIVMHFKTDHSEDNMMLLFVGKEEEVSRNLLPKSS